MTGRAHRPSTTTRYLRRPTPPTTCQTRTDADPKPPLRRTGHSAAGWIRVAPVAPHTEHPRRRLPAQHRALHPCGSTTVGPPRKRGHKGSVYVRQRRANRSLTLEDWDLTRLAPAADIRQHLTIDPHAQRNTLRALGVPEGDASCDHPKRMRGGAASPAWMSGAWIITRPCGCWR